MGNEVQPNVWRDEDQSDFWTGGTAARFGPVAVWDGNVGTLYRVRDRVTGETLGAARMSRAQAELDARGMQAAADMDAQKCKRCGTRSDWHDAITGACPDDDGPHPYSEATDDAEGMV